MMFRNSFTSFLKVLLVPAVMLFSGMATAAPVYQYVYAPGIDWYSAQDSAVKLGGYLATVTSASEQDLVADEVPSFGGWWIGGTDAAIEGHWEWVTGEPWSYTNWNTGQPDDIEDYDDYIIVNGNQSGKWETRSYYYGSQGFILEINPLGAYASNLRLSDSITPWAVGTPTPHVIWDYTGPETQKRYQIEVSAAPNWNSPEMWATGEVNSSQHNITYAGSALVQGQRYYVRVRVSSTFTGDDWGSWNIRTFTYIGPPYNTRYGIVQRQGMTWLEARDSAEALGAHLVTITNLEEQNIVSALVAQGDWWMGANDRTVEGVWEWVNDEEFAYSYGLGSITPNTDANDVTYLAVYEGNRWLIANENETYIDGFIYEIPLPGPYARHIYLTDSLTGDTVISPFPQIGWQYTHSDFGQAGYEIEIGTDTNWNVAETWSSGQVLSSDTEITYSGPALEHAQQYYIRVRVSDGTYWGEWRTSRFLYADFNRLYSFQAVAIPGLSWYAARDSAYAMGGVLATITTQREQQLAASAVASAGGWWWIGATDMYLEGNWEWLNGDPWSFTHWGNSEPNSGSSANGALLQGNPSGGWIDYDQNSTAFNGFILKTPRTGSTGPPPHNIQVTGRYIEKYLVDSLPIFVWSTEGNASPQTAYQIQVGSDHDWTNAELWDSGPVQSADTSIMYGGLLPQHAAYNYFRIRIFSGSKWSSWVDGQFLFHDLRVESIFLVRSAPGLTWANARDSAYAEGGYLATITSEHEQQRIASVLPTTSSLLWIGATDEDSESVWQWITGESWDYTFWRAGEPNGGTGENYATTGGGGGWVDQPGTAHLGYVLEIPTAGPALHSLRLADTMIATTIANPAPTVHWTYRNSGGAAQTRYEIELGTDDDWTAAELWSTGQITSDADSSLYGGLPMNDGGRYFLRMRVGDSQSWSEWDELSFTLFDSTKHSYLLISVPRTYEQAADSAWRMGGYLASIESGFEDALIRDRFFIVFDYYLGASDFYQEGTWTWQDGTPVSFTNWYPGEPNGGTGQNYMYAEPSFEYKWVDISGLEKLWFIVEWDDSANLNRIFVDGLSPNKRVISGHPLISWTSWDGVLPQDSVEIEVGTDGNWDTAEMWNPSVISSDSSSLVYDGTPLEAGTRYFCRVRIAEGGSWQKWSYSYFQINVAPATPVLASTPVIYDIWWPAIPIPPAIDPEGDSLKYIVELYTDSLLQALYLTDTSSRYASGASAFWAPDSAFHENELFWWRCRSFDGYAVSGWSNVGSFALNAFPEPPNLPTPISPAAPGDTIVFSLTPLMTWQASDPDPLDTISCTLEISTDSSFASKSVFDSLDADELTLPDSLNLGTKYWWRVAASDQTALSSGFSPAATFRTWLSGDADNSGQLNVADLNYLVLYMFLNGDPPVDLIVADANGDCKVNIVDVNYLVAYIFLSGNPPKAGCAP